MAFDVESARKAGYADAEIADFLGKQQQFDASAARKAGYSDAEIIAKLAGTAAPNAADAIPGAAPGQVAPAPNWRQPSGKPQSAGDKVIGAGEAALSTLTGATTGTVGLLAGGLQGLATEILAGRFGTPQAEKAVQQAAIGGAQALTYAPRTEAGQDQTEAVAEVIQNLIPVGAVAPALIPAQLARGVRGAPANVVARGAVEGVVRDVAGNSAAAGVAKAGDAAMRVADLASKNISTLPRKALEALRQESTPTPGTMGSVGAAGTDMAAQRRAVAQNLPAPLQLTKGQATRDPAQLKFEVETAKLPEQGAPLRQRLVEQNDAILKNFDAWIDQTGAEAPNLRAVGQAVDRALVEQAARDKTAIRVAYKNAEKAGEMEAPVTLQSVVQHLNDSAPDAAVTPLLDAARRRAVQLGLAVEEGGQLVPRPVPLKTAELYRRAISNATDYEPTNIRQSTIIKGLVDEATNGVGGDLYRQARQLRSRYAQNYENRAAISNLLGTKRGTADRRVAFEDVFDTAILKGSLDDVRNVRRVLQRGGTDGQQAWKELQGQTVQYLKGEATKNVATDSAGNRVISPAGLDRAIKNLDHDGRLEFIFGKKGAQQLRDINELAQYVKTVPPEAAVNTSNTASALLAGFVDVGTSGATGIPLPIATMVRVVRQHVKDSALRRRIEDALNDIAKRAPNNKRKAPAVQEPQQTIH